MEKILSANRLRFLADVKWCKDKAEVWEQDEGTHDFNLKMSECMAESSHENRKKEWRDLLAPNKV